MATLTRLEKAERSAAVRERIVNDSVLLDLNYAQIARAVRVGAPPRPISPANISSYVHMDPARRALPSPDVCNALDVVLHEEPGTFCALAGYPPNANAIQADPEEAAVRTAVQRLEAALRAIQQPESRALAADLSLVVVERIGSHQG